MLVKLNPRSFVARSLVPGMVCNVQRYAASSDDYALFVAGDPVPVAYGSHLALLYFVIRRGLTILDNPVRVG